MDKATQSKERLSGALLELLKTVPYEDITVQRISDHAGVSRMAFYRNFDSKDDVIRYYLEKLTDQFLRESHIEEDASFGSVYFRKQSLIGSIPVRQRTAKACCGALSLRAASAMFITPGWLTAVKRPWLSLPMRWNRC